MEVRGDESFLEASLRFEIAIEERDDRRRRASGSGRIAKLSLEPRRIRVLRDAARK